MIDIEICSSLPNVEYINKILVNLKMYPTIWYNARNVNIPYDILHIMIIKTRNIASNLYPNEFHAIRDIIYALSRDDSIHTVSNLVAAEEAWGSILALIAYEECAYLLKSEPDELRSVIALNGHKNTAAILLLPATICLKFSDAIDQNV